MRPRKLFLFAALSVITFGATAPARAQSDIYEPLVDRDARGFKEKKYQKDLAFCRNRAAPQADAAHAGAAQAQAGAEQMQAGAALSAAGDVARFMPVPGLGAAQGLWAGGTAANAVGGAMGAQGAATGVQGAVGAEMAAQDYALVVNRCLQRRGYVLLR